MAAFKAEWPERFDHFPETIPEGAKGAKWMVRPSFLQGSGYYKLSFYITDDYINRIYDKYAGGDTVYSWNSEMIWVNEVSGSSIHFFLDDYIDESQKKNIELIVLYDNNDINHHHDEGICINRIEGYICYWTE